MGITRIKSWRKSRLRWHPNVLHFLGMLILFMLSVGSVAVVESAARTTEVTLDRALEEYRQTEPPPPQPAAGTGEVAAPTEPRAPGGPALPSPAPAAPAPPEAAAAPAPPQPVEAVAFAPPAAGVYRYRATGGESVNMPGADRRYPEESYATVRHSGGCRWRFEHAVAEEHVDRRDYCSKPGAVLFHGGETRVAFFGQTDGSRIVCEPPALLVGADDEPGATHTATCRGDDTEMEETVTFVGREDLVIGGVTVPAYHLRMDATISGRAEGTSHSKLWLHPDSGLLLKVERQTDTTTNAFGGQVRYQEHATFELLGLDPAS